MNRFNSNQYQPYSRSPPLTNMNPKQYHSRIPSSLKRSSDLLSMEDELHELLKNSNLNPQQKKAFQEMLESTFDLFQTPLAKSIESSRSNRNVIRRSESLIDGSSVALYGKMQSLVAALTALIMHEEESSRLDETNVYNHQPLGNSTVDDGDSSNEFSEDEEQEDISHNNSSFLRRINSPVGSRYTSPSLNHSQLYSPSGNMYANSNGLRPNSRISSRPSSRTFSSRPEPNFGRNSPSFRSSTLPMLEDNQSYNSSFENIGHARPYEAPNELNKPSFQAIQTSVPRSFSGQTSNHRPKSMYQNSNLNSQQFQQRQVYSPSHMSRGYSMGYDSFDETHNPQDPADRYNNDMDPNVSVSSSSNRKRYSMRF